MPSAFLGQLIEALPLAVFCKDYESGKGVFVHWNRGAEALWGLSRKDVLGKSDYDFFPKDQADFFRQKDLDTLQNATQILIPEEPVDSPSLGRRIVRTWKVPMHDAAGKGRYLLGISQDISDLKALEGELNLQRQSAVAAARLASLGEMASGIAHEINNPLAVLLGLNEKIERLTLQPNLPIPVVQQTLETSRRTIMRMKTIVEGLRAFSRDGSRDPQVHKDMREVIEDALALCREKFNNRGIELKYAPPPNPLCAMCQPVQIAQVLVNLLNNAHDAVVGRDNPWIRIELLDQPGPKVQVRITDSGAGVPPEVASRLFEPFVTSKPVGQGTGLGLSISRGIMEAHDGSLYYDSTAANTTFVIDIRQVAASPEIPSNAA